MVCYFILRHIRMIGSHRQVRRQGRKPGTSSPTRRRLGRGGGRSQIAKCSLSPAVLPDLATGTTARRHYRPLLPPPTEGPSASPRMTSGTTARKRYYRTTGTTGRAGPVLPDLAEPKRVNSAQRLVTLSIFHYLFPKYPCLCGWPINRAPTPHVSLRHR